MADDVVVFGLLVAYKIFILAAGLGFAFMGYKLFMADKSRTAGDLQVKTGRYGFSLQGGAPGVFFSLFGTVLICFSVFKGLDFQHSDSGERMTRIGNIISNTLPVPTKETLQSSKGSLQDKERIEISGSQVGTKASKK